MGRRIRRWPRRAPLVIYCLHSLPSTSAAPTRFPRPSHALPTRFATRAADGAPRRAPRRARAARRSRPRAPVRSTPRLRRGTLRAYDAARYAPRVQRGALFVAAGFSAGGFVQALVGAQHGAVARGGRVRRARRPAADRGAAGVRAVPVRARARARRVLLQTWHGALGAGLAGMPCRWCCWICSACCSRRAAQCTCASAALAYAAVGGGHGAGGA